MVIAYTPAIIIVGTKAMIAPNSKEVEETPNTEKTEENVNSENVENNTDLEKVQVE